MLCVDIDAFRYEFTIVFQMKSAFPCPSRPPLMAPTPMTPPLMAHQITLYDIGSPIYDIMSFSTWNTFEGILNMKNTIPTPQISRFWISNVQPTSLTLNWTGIFNSLTVFNGNTFLQNVRTKYINVTNVNGNNVSSFSVTPIVNNVAGTTQTLRIQYVSMTPVANTAIPSNTINAYVYDLSGETGSTDYKNGRYIVSSSSTGLLADTITVNKVLYSYYAFDNLSTTYWINDYSVYNPSNPYSNCVYNTVLQSSSPSFSNGARSVSGEWLQIQLPHEIQIYNYTLKFFNQYFSTRYFLFGSTDGENWDAVDMRTNKSSTTIVVTNLNSLNTYSYIRFVSNTNNGINPNVVGMVSFSINGILYV